MAPAAYACCHAAGSNVMSQATCLTRAVMQSVALLMPSPEMCSELCPQVPWCHMAVEMLQSPSADTQKLALVTLCLSFWRSSTPTHNREVPHPSCMHCWGIMLCSVHVQFFDKPTGKVSQLKRLSGGYHLVNACPDPPGGAAQWQPAGGGVRSGAGAAGSARLPICGKGAPVRQRHLPDRRCCTGTTLQDPWNSFSAVHGALTDRHGGAIAVAVAIACAESCDICNNSEGAPFPLCNAA